MSVVLVLTTVVPVAAAKMGDDRGGIEGGPAEHMSGGTTVQQCGRHVDLPVLHAQSLATAETLGRPGISSRRLSSSPWRGSRRAVRSLARNLPASAPAAPPTAMHDCAELLDISLAHTDGRHSADATGATTWLSAVPRPDGTNCQADFIVSRRSTSDIGYCGALSWEYGLDGQQWA
jgi:hypothetical protein